MSVVVPTHNRSRLLSQTLHSILWQRGVDFEVVIVDDGSRDDTARMLATLGDRRVRWVRHDTPQGLSVARNRGAAEARGEWVAFCDDDDLWAPDKLAQQVAAAEREAASWAYVGSVNVTLDLRVVGGAPAPPPHAVLEQLRRGNAVPGSASSVLIRASVVRDLGGFAPEYRHHADWDLWLRLSRHGTPAAVSHPLVGCRIHSGNRSLDTAGMIAELALLEKRHGIRVDRVAFFRHVARVSLRTGRNRDALRYYLRAAARCRSSYLFGGFVSDALRAASAPVRSRLPQSPLRRVLEAVVAERSNQAWLAEGRSWVRELNSIESVPPVSGRPRPA